MHSWKATLAMCALQPAWPACMHEVHCQLRPQLSVQTAHYGTLLEATFSDS